jgi:GNAT superfamily N-acetyltransferase
MDRRHAVTIRHATQADSQQFCRLWRAFLESECKRSPLSESPTNANINRYWEQFQGIVKGRVAGITLVAEANNKLVGVFMAADYATETERMGGRGVAISGEWVEPEYRQQGLAKQMESQALAWARDQGLWDFVVLVMNPDNKNKELLEAGRKGNPNDMAVQAETWYCIPLDQGENHG